MAKSMCSLIWVPVLALLINYVILSVFLISGVSFSLSVEWEPYPPHRVLRTSPDCSLVHIDTR